MHLANQSSGKPDKLSQSSMGGALDIREAHRLHGESINQKNQRTTRDKGNARS